MPAKNIIIDGETLKYLGADKVYDIIDEIQKDPKNNGKTVMSEGFMLQIARELRDYIRRNMNLELLDGPHGGIRKYAQHVNVIDRVNQLSDGSYEVEICVTGMELSRVSLIDEEGRFHGRYGGYTGRGINNIFALWNNGVGYVIPSVYGINEYWEPIYNKRLWPTTLFIQDAVTQFKDYLNTLNAHFGYEININEVYLV